MYKAVVLCTLLYCCETWTLYRCHIKQLEQFHQRCLRKTCNIKWQDRVSNLEVLDKCQIPSIESMLIQSQLRWTGHVVRMDDCRIPKRLLYGQLKLGTRTRGRPLKRYKDALKSNLQCCNIDPLTWEECALDRALWRRTCHTGIQTFEAKRTKALQDKREQRKQGLLIQGAFPCNVCGKVCGSGIGLYSHMRTHPI